MKPKYRYLVSEKASIPAALVDFYIEKEGYLVLDVDGAASATTLAEFRQNNLGLRASLEAVASAATGRAATEFVGMDIPAITTIVTTAREAAEQAGTAKGKEAIEAAAKAQVDALKAAHTAEVAKVKGDLETSRKELSKVKIDNAVLQEAGEGLHANSGGFLVLEAAKVFTLDDKGQIVAKNPDGTPKFNDKGEPFTIKDWTAVQQGITPFLWKESNGSNSDGGNKGAGGGGGGNANGPNPWSKEGWNVSKQGALYKSDKATAIKMAAQHGVTLPP